MAVNQLKTNFRINPFIEFMSRIAGRSRQTKIITRPSTAPYNSLSLRQLRQWVCSSFSLNDVMQFIPLTKKEQSLQQLSTGETYAQLMVQLFPSVVEKKKIKSSPRNELERIQNWKVLQNGLTVLKVEKHIPIVELIKPNSARHLDFCRWFISFYEANKNQPQKTIEGPAPRFKSAPTNTASILNTTISQPEAVILHAVPVGDRTDALVTGRTPLRTKRIEQEKSSVAILENPVVLTPEEQMVTAVQDVSPKRDNNQWEQNEPDLVRSTVHEIRDMKTTTRLEMTPPMSTNFDPRIRAQPKLASPKFVVPKPKSSQDTLSLETPRRSISHNPRTVQLMPTSDRILTRMTIPNLKTIIYAQLSEKTPVVDESDL